jgi:hypothetical protein
MAESLKRISGVEGDAYMKDTDHPIRHLCAHFGDRASARWRGSYARQNAQDGCGMAPCWAGGPHFCTRFRAQSESWVAPAQQETSLVRAARMWAKQLKKVGITHFSFVFSIFFSLGCA